MIITKQSPVTGKVNSLDLPITEAELTAWRNSRKTIQSVFPHLNNGQREFLMTGITPEDWASMFGSTA